MQGMTIGLPTVSRHRSNAGPWERAGLASSKMEANIGRAVTKRERLFLKELLRIDIASPPNILRSNLTNVSADGVASSAIPACGVKVPRLGWDLRHVQPFRRSFRC